MITLPAIQIVPPSDFKIKLTSVKDELGNDIDVTTTFIGFTFFVDGDAYEVVSDPINNKFTNAVIEGGVLYLIFQGYKFQYGRMSYVQHERYDDMMYSDHTADYYTQKTDTNLYFVR